LGDEPFAQSDIASNGKVSKTFLSFGKIQGPAGYFYVINETKNILHVTSIPGNGDHRSLFSKMLGYGEVTKPEGREKGPEGERKVTLSQDICGFIEIEGPGISKGKGEGSMLGERERDRGEKS
jgi:hypothetical protein